MDEMNPEPGAAEAPAEPEPGDGAAAPAELLTQNLMAMGKKLAAALLAAGSTPEAEAVKADLRDGMESMRQEVDKALQRVPTAKVSGSVQSGVQRGGEVAASGTQRLRVEAAGALREVNRILDNLASSLQGEAAKEPEPPAPGTPGE